MSAGRILTNFLSKLVRQRYLIWNFALAKGAAPSPTFAIPTMRKRSTA